MDVQPLKKIVRSTLVKRDVYYRFPDCTCMSQHSAYSDVQPYTGFQVHGTHR